MIEMKELNPHNYTTTEEQAKNLEVLLERLNKIRAIWGKPMIVTSGLRSQDDQARINPSAPKSNHLLGAAADIKDDGELRDWILKNLDICQKIGLWFEDFRWTKGWVHFQILPPHSGHRIYVPSSTPATNPTSWSGEYDEKFDS